jgi:hypothetical protein
VAHIDLNPDACAAARCQRRLLLTRRSRRLRQLPEEAWATPAQSR